MHHGIPPIVYLGILWYTKYMSKIIKLTDEVYLLLQNEAVANGRSMAGQIRFMLSSPKKSVPQAEEQWVEVEDGTLLLNQIKALEGEINNADVDNQDPDYWVEVNNKKQRIQELWQSWHRVTGR